MKTINFFSNTFLLIVALASLLCLLLAFAGCGDSSPGASSAGPGVTANQSTCPFDSLTKNGTSVGQAGHTEYRCVLNNGATAPMTYAFFTNGTMYAGDTGTNTATWLQTSYTVNQADCSLTLGNGGRVTSVVVRASGYLSGLNYGGDTASSCAVSPGSL